MNKRGLIIKDIIDYLTAVSISRNKIINNKNNKIINDKKQDFFISIPHLNNILREYFIYFKNKNKLDKALHYNYNLIKDLSFSKGEKSFQIIKDDSSIETVSYSIEEHNRYSNNIHSHLIKVFEDKLEIKKAKEKRRITIRNKKVYDLVKILNLKLDFLKNGSLPKDFIDVLIGKSDKKIYLNIDNRSFHYLLDQIREYFYNFSMTSVANTDKIHGYTGTLLNAKNLNASKSYNPKGKDVIDEVLKKIK